MSSDISGMLSFLCFISAVVFALILRRTKLTHISDYQAGLRFRDSTSFRVLGPGSYRVFAQRNPITVADMRPHVFLLERLMFQDMMRANAVISVGGTVVICDPQLALTTMKNVADDSLVVVREGLVQTVTHSI